MGEHFWPARSLAFSSDSKLSANAGGLVPIGFAVVIPVHHLRLLPADKSQRHFRLPFRRQSHLESGAEPPLPSSRRLPELGDIPATSEAEAAQGATFPWRIVQGQGSNGSRSNPQ